MILPPKACHAAYTRVQAKARRRGRCSRLTSFLNSLGMEMRNRRCTMSRQNLAGARALSTRAGFMEN